VPPSANSPSEPPQPPHSPSRRLGSYPRLSSLAQFSPRSFQTRLPSGRRRPEPVSRRGSVEPLRRRSWRRPGRAGELEKDRAGDQFVASLPCSRGVSVGRTENKLQPIRWQFSVLCDLVGGQNCPKKCWTKPVRCNGIGNTLPTPRVGGHHPPAQGCEECGSPPAGS
jgi:hypothetical protein